MENKEKVEVPATTDLPLSFVVLLKEGSYAIVLFIVILFVVLRKALGSFFDKHLSLIEAVENNSKTLADSYEVLVKATDRISRQNTILLKFLRQRGTDQDLLDEVEEED